MSRTPFAYATSHRIDETVVELADGSRLNVLLKRLELSDPNRIRPEWLIDPHREVVAYQLLGDAGLGTPAFLGVDGGWMVLEKVDGVPLWQCGEKHSWLASARWLGAFHTHFAHRRPQSDHLVSYDANYFRLWPERTRARHPEAGHIVAGYERVVDILTSLPVTLVHGEFYPSNIVVAGDRIAPVDWEMTGIGPGVLDLAALVTGWGESERTAMVTAYGDVTPEALIAAEIHLAMRWLGWAEGWNPPAEHARDWLTELRNASESLESLVR